ncbi:MAG: hypothetical protein HY859_00890 [Caulobacterales bacterium]|nr:hypothetical protein [Caulobacterales bacterium]
MSRAAEAFRGRTVAIMILVGVLAFAGLTVLSVYAPQLSSGDDGRAQPLSRSAVGFAGAVKFFQARGRTVLVSRGPIRGEGAGVLLLTPGPGMTHKDLDRVAYDGARVVVLPKWNPRPHPFHKGWVVRDAAVPTLTLEKDLLLDLGLAPHRRTVTGTRTLWWIYDDGTSSRIGETGPITSFQTISGSGLKGLEAVVVDQDGGVVLGWLPKRSLYVLADPDLLNTQGLRSLATASVADAMIGQWAPDAPLIFDVTLHGYKRSRSLLTLALEPPFLGGTLCAFAAALLAGLGAAVRFGPVRRPPPPFAMGKEALVDSTAGLIRMARREPRMTQGYARLCRALVARGVGAPRQLEEEALEAFLDRLGASRGATSTFSDLMRDARATQDLAALMAVTRKLYDWRLEMTREHR